MQLRLKNINKIEDATINMNGLTVIAGINDTGKSTVGKVLFTLIKAINRAANTNEDTKRQRIERLVFNLYFFLKSLERHGTSDLLGVFFPLSSKSFIEDIITPSGVSILEDLAYSVEGFEMNPQQKARLLRYVNDIKRFLEESTDPTSVFTKELQESIEAEFLNNICSYKTNRTKIEFVETTDMTRLEIEIENNVVQVVSGISPADFSIEDITFIESPLYIHLIDTLREAPTLKEQRSYSRLSLAPFINYHVKDLAQKLDAIRFLPQQPQLQFSEKLINVEKIKNITGGKFVFDTQTKNIYWKKDGIKYSPVNVASGLKSFGVMQILGETQAINENKMLVWDEPENHLHPEWQVRLAELIVEMSKAGIPILISSHSPYFIQAIRYFARKHELEKYVSYYLTEEQDNGLSKIEEVSDDLNRVFYKLAQPMNEIINLGM